MVTFRLFYSYRGMLLGCLHYWIYIYGTLFRCCDLTLFAILFVLPLLVSANLIIFHLLI